MIVTTGKNGSGGCSSGIGMPGNWSGIHMEHDPDNGGKKGHKCAFYGGKFSQMGDHSVLC